jgi:hypothetical protein
LKRLAALHGGSAEIAVLLREVCLEDQSAILFADSVLVISEDHATHDNSASILRHSRLGEMLQRSGAALEVGDSPIRAAFFKAVGHRSLRMRSDSICPHTMRTSPSALGHIALRIVF